MTAIRGKIGCVSGGIAGLGFEFSKSLIRNGLKGLVVADINDAAAPEAVKKLEEYGDTAVKFVKADLSNLYQAECMLKKVIENFEHLDILVNNAGVVGESRYERTIKINYISVLYTTMLALYQYMPKYKSGDEGIVVNIASTFGLKPGYSTPAYSTSKHAVVSLGRAFGTNYYYNRYKVKILTMCPGYTPTPLTKSPDVDLDVDLFFKEIGNYAPQRAIFCGNCLERMLKNPENGAVWVTEGEEIYRYPIENTFKRKTS